MITEQQIQEFVKKLSDKYATPEDQFPRTYGYEILKRYARITYKFNGQVSVHCFVDMENGNIHKAAGWSGPVRKNIRGNILDADPLAGVMYCGAVYIKKC